MIFSILRSLDEALIGHVRAFERHLRKIGDDPLVLIVQGILPPHEGIARSRGVSPCQTALRAVLSVQFESLVQLHVRLRIAPTAQ